MRKTDRKYLTIGGSVIGLTRRRGSATVQAMVRRMLYTLHHSLGAFVVAIRSMQERHGEELYWLERNLFQPKNSSVISTWEKHPLIILFCFRLLSTSTSKAGMPQVSLYYVKGWLICATNSTGILYEFWSDILSWHSTIRVSPCK